MRKDTCVSSDGSVKHGWNIDLSQHILRVNYWKLGEHDKLDMFEPVWFVQHVNVDG